ncbi:hypothetical protein BDV96DRAFT_126927 [Lophiotrema nucula]|uniref:Uncharacterized protein n=1 Tax=Lophiotrema nucula TaxID=690887 RepID=A0A6A5Z201_9PLEO|nr:hypothetical protein BDV96DRAFT_126927 [Lophiotrema nucula]
MLRLKFEGAELPPSCLVQHRVPDNPTPFKRAHSRSNALNAIGHPLPRRSPDRSILSSKALKQASTFRRLLSGPLHLLLSTQIHYVAFGKTSLHYETPPPASPESLSLTGSLAFSQIPPSDADKTFVSRRDNPNPFPAGYDVGEEVEMGVEEGNRTIAKSFIIKDSQRNGLGTWEYQLEEKNDPPTGQLYRGGDWFPEGDLD